MAVLAVEKLSWSYSTICLDDPLEYFHRATLLGHGHSGMMSIMVNEGMDLHGDTHYYGFH